MQRALDGELVPTIADLKEASTSLMVLRNFIVAPITEEIVFRSCMVPLLLPQLGYGYSLAWITPLFFGIVSVWCSHSHLSASNKRFLHCMVLQRCPQKNIFNQLALLFIVLFFFPFPFSLSLSLSLSLVPSDFEGVVSSSL